MKPRLPFSSKWTPIPDELTHQITQVFAETFSNYLKKGRVFVEGRIYLREVLLRVGYVEKGRLGQDCFEVSIEYMQEKDNMVKMIHLGVDCTASLLEQFFKNPEELPPIWKGLQVEGREVFCQYTKENPELEAEANKILGEDNDGLVRGEDEEEELDAKISLLGLSSEDFPEGSHRNPKKKTKS